MSKPFFFNKKVSVAFAFVFVCFAEPALAKDASLPEAPAPAASGYKAGFARGKQDGAGGLSRTPSRWESEYSQADRKEFFRGYEDGYTLGIKPAPKGETVGKSYGEPLKAVNGKGAVVIKEGKRTLAVCKTALPNIEQTRFIEEQNKIVIKSRGNHGPATVELFNSQTGKLEGSVKAYEIINSGPKWAEGMAD